MKRAIFFVVLLFLMIGAVCATDNITDTQDTLGDDDASQMELDDDDDAGVDPNATGSEAPTITTSAVKGTQGKTITLKAIVKNSTGPVSGVTVTFKLNGATYTAVSDANGIASKTVKCPNSAVLKTTTKKTSSRMTKTTYYSKTYTATASIDGATSSFEVTSKKAKLVKKYKAVKKTKVINAPIKKGTKIFKRGSYALVTYKTTKYGINFLGAAMAQKDTEGSIKFFAKIHYKQNGKWHWSKWIKIPKNKIYESQYPTSIKAKTLKAKYTQVSYKRIS